MTRSPTFDAAFRDELDQLFRWRRDVRRFRTDPVPEDLVSEILATADLAPSVGNSQPWRFLRVRAPERRADIIADFENRNAEALAKQNPDRQDLYATLKLEGLRESPVQFAVYCDEATDQGFGLGQDTMPETRKYSVVMAIHTLWLAARARGLGVGWVSILSPDEVSRVLSVPEDWTFVAYLCLGWPVEYTDVPELERLGWQARLENAKALER